RTLFKGQMNPDLGNEQIIEEEGSVEGNIFKIGEMSYRAVVIPSFITIRRGTIEMLEQFVAGGGALFSCGMMPRLVDGEEDAEALARLESITQIVTLEELAVKVREAIVPMVQITGDGAENIWLAVRSVDGGYTIQLSNISRHQGVKANLSIADKSATLALWNPVDGSGQRLERESDGTLRLDFDPAQTWVMTIGNEALANGASGTYSTQGEKVEVGRLEGRWAMRRLDPNAIPLDFARWSTDGTEWHEAEPVLALYTRWCSEPYDGPLWLEYSFDAELLPKVCGVAVEQPHIYNSISINGHELSFVNAGHYIDHTFRTADIARYLQQGTNRILLQLDNVSARRTSSDAIERYGSEIETIYIYGDFGVKSALAAEQPTASWRNRRPILPQKPLPASFAHGSFSLSSEPDSVGRNITLEGYPFYAGAVELSRRFVVPAAGGNGRVLLDFRGTEAIVINVSVNGVEMPPVYSSPWQCDITDALCDGGNDLKVTLVGSLRNLMGPYHNAGAEFCGVGPATFTGADDWPQEEKGDALWYEARKGGKALLWRDNYYCIPFGIMQSPRILVQR
ncbi:MAG: hypothetical protein HUJ91_07365, partial [Bacteroidales bacterium]|nr:hypothetical protein [Bacteroidales bacterium]